MLSRVRSVPRRVSGPRQRRCQARATMSESDSQMPLAGGRGGLAHAALWAYWGGARWHTVTEAGDPACGGMLSQASGGADFDRKTEAVQTLSRHSLSSASGLAHPGSPPKDRSYGGRPTRNMLTFIATWPRMRCMGTFALLLMAALSSAAPLPGDADFDPNSYVTRGALLNETFHALSGDVEGSSATDKDSTIEIMPGEIDRVSFPSHDFDTHFGVRAAAPSRIWFTGGRRGAKQARGAYRERVQVRVS